MGSANTAKSIISPLTLGVTSMFGNLLTPPKAPAPVAPPQMSPLPQKQDLDPEMTEEKRRKKLESLRFGFASTMTNKLNNPAPISQPSAQPLKTALGQ